MTAVRASKGIIIEGRNPNWHPVLLNIMNKAGIKADTLPSLKQREFILWLFSKKSCDYKIIYCFGGITPIFYILARLRGKRIISHWIGSDAMCYQGRVNLRKRFSIWVHQHFVNLALADSERVQEELRSVGIETKLLRLLPQAIVGEVKALPEKPTVLSYWSNERFDFYNGQTFLALAKAFPEVNFVVAKADGKGLQNIPSNVQFLGLVDNNKMSHIYQNCTCLLRMPQHDGLSAMVLEAMAHGRYVIYNYKFPFTYFAKDFGSAAKALREIINKRELNFEGFDYVKNNYSIDSEANCLRGLMEDVFGNISTVDTE
jgi:glycosyltransferase involved in cell wall biosynthesis